jgi:hypothetical protein
MPTNDTENTVPGAVRIKMWTRGVPGALAGPG